MGLVYTGSGYETYYLKKAWEAVGDPRKFKEVCDWIRANPSAASAVTRHGTILPGSGHFPDNDGDDIRPPSSKRGGQLYVQIQNVEHKIIFPNEVAEAKLQPAPWWS